MTVLGRNSYTLNNHMLYLSRALFTASSNYMIVE